jgi:Predicted transcriptional regulators
MELHEKIKYVREYRGKTREELADYIGQSYKTIAGIELGNRPVQSTALKAIAKYLEIPVSFFFDENIKTVEEALDQQRIDTIAKDKEKYGGFFKMVDVALDEGITPEEFKVFLEFRRKIKKQD